MLKPIKSKKKYEAALQQVYTLMQKDIKPGSKLSDELEALSILVEAYEKKHYPMPRHTQAVVDPKVGNYEKHPFFVKKANAAKALLKTTGLPKKLSKAK